METATPWPLAELADDVDAELAALDLPAEPAGLYAPVRYVLDGGGKRVRPALVLLAADAFGGEPARAAARPAALGVEVFHNFTLVHDDIMDHAATRRGRPTVHERWDTPTAILTGDLMMGLAARLVVGEGPGAGARAEAHYRTVARLCEGQALDMAFESRDDVTVDEYLAMIDRKTGALLEHALELGAMAGGAPRAAVASLRQAGLALGRAFQIQDDLLDLTADARSLGKSIGGDLVEGKRTFLVLTARRRAQAADRDWLAQVLDGGVAPADVAGVRDRLEVLGVLDAAAQAVAHFSEAGRAGLASLPPGSAGDALRALALGLATRTF